MTTECEYCGSDLTQEEIENPEPEGALCEDCYHEHFEFTCSRCCNFDHVDYQDIWLVVFQTVSNFPERGEIQPGIYEIIAFPYHGGIMLGEAWLHGGSLRRTPAGIDFTSGNYACGHLCRECAKVLRLKQSKKGKAFHRGRLVEKT